MKFAEETRSRLLCLVALCVFLSIPIAGCSGGKNPVSLENRVGNPLLGDVRTTPAVQPGILSPYSVGSTSASVPRWVENEVLVVLKSGVNPLEAASALRHYPLRLKKTIRLNWAAVYELVITDGTDVTVMVNRLRSNPLVRIAEPNYIYTFDEAPYFPNDPMWESSDDGDDPRDSAYEQWGPAMIGASIVWNESKGSDDVVVAVIDTGVRFDHEDLNANIWINEDEIKGNGVDDDSNGYVDDWWGWDCMDSDNDPYDDGAYAWYHGTACSGVVAAVQDNFRGVSGVAPGVKVMALKVDLTGYGAFESTVIEALQYAADNGADICSMSFGNWDYSEILENTCIDIWDNGNGVILMASAGNEDNTQIRYPSAFASVMTIGATVPWSPNLEPIDETRISAAIGYYWGSCYGEQLDVMGYGDKYTTTHGSHYDSYWDGFDNGFFGGTSCACPMSAGVMALIKSFFPEKNGQWCWERLRDTADDLDVPGFDIQTGYGRCNAVRAVYGSDRFKSQEDPNGFVTLTLPGAQVFDTIHDVAGNPYYDVQDLYRVTTNQDGTLLFNLDIFTLGEDLDLAVYSDEALTQLIDSATGENHAGSSWEELFVNASMGQQFFVKVYSPAPGNSSTYGLKVHQLTDEIWVSGESIAPHFIHQQGTKVPFLKLVFEAGSAATLDELIINKHGTLPNANWINARLYRDSNGNKYFDSQDQLVCERFPQARNRVRMPDLGIEWNYHAPLILFFAADFAKTVQDCTVSFSLETYKDVITEEGIVAHYSQFPIESDELVVGTDTDPPQWAGTVGIQYAKASYKSARIGWNSASDALTPPVAYNVYYTTTLPFDIATAVKLSKVSCQSGETTDWQYTVPNLTPALEHHFVVRAVDQAGNEDQNLVIKSCTPSSTGDPQAPVVLSSFPLNFPQEVDVSGALLVVADDYAGLMVFDRSDPVNLKQLGNWYGDGVISVRADGHYAYCGGYNYFTVVDLSYPLNPTMTDQTASYYSYSVAKIGNWVYVAGYFGNVLPVDVSNPYDIKQATPLSVSGYPMDIAVNQGAMYVAVQYSGIQAFDRSNPASPINKGTFGLPATGLALAGGTLFSIDEYYTSSLVSYNIQSNPFAPPMLDSVYASWQPTSITIRGNYAYVADGIEGLMTLDASDPSDIKFVGKLQGLGTINGMVTDGTFIYAVGTDKSGYGRLWVII